jgi:integrase
MTARRERGEGGLHWDENRQRWIAAVTIGYDGRGKRVFRRASGKTKSEAKEKLKELVRDHDDGLTALSGGYTVADAVNYWLAYGLSGRDLHTVSMYRTYAETHIFPVLGKRKLRQLTVDNVERLLSEKSSTLSTRSLKIIHSILNRSVRHAQVRDKVRRNVVMLCDVPAGRQGRPSKSLTLDQADAILKASENSPLRAYIVLSLLTGARTEELRALLWRDVDLTDESDAVPAIRPSIALWRSVRAGGDTKTRKSRRTLALAQLCVDVLTTLWDQRQCGHAERAECDCLVFVSKAGTPLDAHNVRRSFRKVVVAAGLVAKDWTPRELRHSFVSLLSDAGVPLEKISRLVGHRTTTVTETVYRKQLRPVIEDAATAMDRIFPGGTA